VSRAASRAVRTGIALTSTHGAKMTQAGTDGVGGYTQPTALLVDDDESTHWLLATALRGGPLRLTWARSPIEGLRLVRDLQPQLVLIGFDADEVCLGLCRAIKGGSHALGLPILVLARRDEPPLRRALLAGADAVLCGAFAPFDFWAAVRQAAPTTAPWSAVTVERPACAARQEAPLW
jgi:DNA-binding response OmpR family regulator